jgi:hypothetical protein
MDGTDGTVTLGTETGWRLSLSRRTLIISYYQLPFKMNTAKLTKIFGRWERTLPLCLTFVSKWGQFFKTIFGLKFLIKEMQRQYNCLEIWPFFGLFWDEPKFGRGFFLVVLAHFFTPPLLSLAAELSASWQHSMYLNFLNFIRLKFIRDRVFLCRSCLQSSFSQTLIGQKFVYLAVRIVYPIWPRNG